ncbi:MAG: hypothetical protein RBS13_06260 [Bacteroidales bacterium]|jgi:hypothetical protein|nr:hypothetical protein [Bacteroidales bacterium]
MKDFYELAYPNISLTLFDYEDMTIYFNKDIWNLVIEFDEDEELYFISNDKLNVYAVRFDMRQLIEDLKERIYGNICLFYNTPDDNLTKDAINLKRVLRESISISYKGETK